MDVQIDKWSPYYRQKYHVIGVLLLSAVLYLYAVSIGEKVFWVVASAVTAGIHQGAVAVIWRSEIHGCSMTRIFGAKSFMIHGCLFFILLATRLGSIVFASVNSPHTFSVPSILTEFAALCISVLGLWTLWSVFKHFGVKRALGADHFFSEYKHKKFVRKGVFLYIPNSMYTFGTLLFLIPGLIFRSQIGFACGLFHYLAVWLHYWATELPDMEYIYGCRS